MPNWIHWADQYKAHGKPDELPRVLIVTNRVKLSAALRAR